MDSAQTSSPAQKHNGKYIVSSCINAAKYNSPDIVQNAHVFLNAPYLWAGRNFDGIDCSGLVQQAYFSAGIRSPRDTYMLRKWAKRVDISPVRVPRGSLGFVGRHVVIFEGNDYVIHADGEAMIVRSQSLESLLSERNLSVDTVEVYVFDGPSAERFWVQNVGRHVDLDSAYTSMAVSSQPTTLYIE